MQVQREAATHSLLTCYIPGAIGLSASGARSERKTGIQLGAAATGIAIEEVALLSRRKTEQR